MCKIVLNRAINYDERDPFLCTSCGFCKYAKFEFTFSAHTCTSVEAINSEEEREKALKSVNTTLEKADQFYQQLSSHRQALETLFKSANEQTKGSGQVCNFCDYCDGSRFDFKIRTLSAFYEKLITISLKYSTGIPNS